jgi:hypothetical protein
MGVRAIAGKARKLGIEPDARAEDQQGNLGRHGRQPIRSRRPRKDADQAALAISPSEAAFCQAGSELRSACQRWMAR